MKEENETDETEKWKSLGIKILKIEASNTEEFALCISVYLTAYKHFSKEIDHT